MEFNELLLKANIFDNRYPVKGCGAYLPYGFKIRKNIIKILTELLEEYNHEEVLFPLLIPERYLMKEAEHIKGFEEEVFWVTHGGKEELGEKLALRPTSETVIYPIIKEHIKTHSDLPIKIFQTVSCFRYETKHTRPLIRVREIMTFNETHTFHKNKEECLEQVKEAINIYSKLFNKLAIPYLIFERPEWDKFPGGEYTLAFDTILKSGRALQIGTVHNLGQKFSKTFEITFEREDGSLDYVYQTCYGVSDRLIAAVIDIHSDEKGLRLPVCIAPIQIIIIPIYIKGKENLVKNECLEIYNLLKDRGFRVELDLREDVRPGKKFNNYEFIGVPIRIEIGPKDIENNSLTIFRRDLNEKKTIDQNNLIETIECIFLEYDKNLLDQAKEKVFKINIFENFEDLKNIDEPKGIYLVPFDKEIYNENIEEKLNLRILGKTKYKNKEYIGFAKTY